MGTQPDLNTIMYLSKKQVINIHVYKEKIISRYVIGIINK